MKEYKVVERFYHVCWRCLTVSEFKKGEIIDFEKSVISGGWRYLPCPSCGYHWGVNIRPEGPYYVISFPYRFLEEVKS